MNRRRQTLDKRRLPLVIVGGLISLVVLTVCAAPPPRGTVQNSQAQPTITSAVGDGPTATPPPPIPVNDTQVKRVRALQTVPIFGGPSKQYVTVGVVAQDATVAVTGISVDGKWWRVPCDARSQIRNQVDCWVEADPLMTAPAADTVVVAAAAPAATDVPPPTATIAAPAATDTPLPAPTATTVAPAATNTALPVPTATEPPPPATATKAAPAATSTKAAPAATATQAAPTATAVPPTPLPSPTAAPPTPTSQAIDLKPTNIQFIITKLEVMVLDAPQTGAVIGSYPAGKKVEVTGYTSGDGLWWRVICPKGNAGNCFVTADPNYTSPAVAPK